MSLLTPATVYSLFPAIASSIGSTATLQVYIDIVEEMVNERLNYIFVKPLPTVSAPGITYGTQNTNGSYFISIDAWQETDLVITETGIENSHASSLTESPLVKGSDYVLWYGKDGKSIPGRESPVTAIKLLKGPLDRNRILKIYGTYGWSTTFPSDLKNMICQIVLELVGITTNFASSGGISGLKRVKSMTVEKEITESMINDLRNQVQDIASNPNFTSVINSYRFLTQNTITVL